MITDTIENSAQASDAEQPRPKRKPGRKAQPAKRAKPAKTPKPKADRVNKKDDVIALMKRAKGATLAEIMKATGWQAHTVRGFVSILAKKGGEKIESSRSADGERTYKIK